MLFLVLSFVSGAAAAPALKNVSVTIPRNDSLNDRLAAFDLRWDPAPLPRGWVDQFRDALRPETRPNCSAAVVAFAADGHYGRSSNTLTEFAHLLEFTASRQEVAIAVAPAVFQRFFPVTVFDFSHLGSWVCVALVEPEGVPTQHTSMKNAYLWYKTDGADAFNFTQRYRPFIDVDLFHGTVISQLLLRPKGPLRARVDGTIAAHGGQRGYVAIHLRSMEGSCHKRLNEAKLASMQRLTAADLGRAVTATDVCGASDAYLAALFAKDGVPETWPLLVVHDSQPPSRARAAQLVKTYGAVDLGSVDAHVALLLLAKSSYLVGQPVSSFSWNMADVRRANGAVRESTNLANDGRHNEYWHMIS